MFLYKPCVTVHTTNKAIGRNESMKDSSNYTQDDGRGFYVALAVCLVAVCGVALTTFVGGLTADTPSTPTTAVTTTAKPVAGSATGVPYDRTTVTTTAITKTTTTTAAPTTTATTATLFVFPVSNTVVQPYSDMPVFSETLGQWSTHDGVDFAADEGQTVKAPADGTVARIFEDALWGDAVELDHGGKVISRLYGVTVKGLTEGDTVKAGDVLGSVSDIPAEIVGERHIHVEVLANGKAIDPLTLIRGETITATTVTTAAETTAATDSTTPSEIG